MKEIIPFILVLLVAQLSWAQPANDDCANATTLCGNQPVLATNTDATVSACAGCSDGSSTAGDFCFALDNTVWFSFTTNDQGGDVSVNFSNINCNNDPTYDNEIQAVVVLASAPCDASTYTAVSNCESNQSTDFSLSAPNLLPNTTYYVLVDGDLNGVGVTNPASCTFNIVATGLGVEYNVDAGQDVSIATGESTTLNGTAPNGFEWTPPNNLSSTTTLDPVASPEETTTYYLSYTADNGCTYVDDVVVNVFEPISVPNTITPNEDGYNDRWVISRIENYPGAEVKVYDRWGQQVFHSIGYTNAKQWDGKKGGKRVPAGTYFYTIDLKNGGKKSVYVGTLTILW